MASSKTKTLKLKEIPADVMAILYDRQNELKKIANGSVSMERTFCRILREYHDLKAGRSAGVGEEGV